MIETQLNRRVIDAQNSAHEARGEALSEMLRAVPRLFSSLRGKR